MDRPVLVLKSSKNGHKKAPIKMNGTGIADCARYAQNLTTQCAYGNNFTEYIQINQITPLTMTHGTMIGLFLIVFVISLVPAVFLCKKQPLKSRGIVIFVIVIAQILRILVEIAAFILRVLNSYKVTELKSEDFYLDVIFEFFSALTICVLFISQFHLIRYLIAISVNDLKVRLSIKKTKISKFRVFVLRTLQSPYPYLVFILLAVLIYAGALLGLEFGLHGSDFSCATQRIQTFKTNARYVSYCFIIIIILGFIGTMIFDFISTCIKWRWIFAFLDYFDKTDKFMFRLESLFIAPFQLVILVIVCLLIVADVIVANFPCIQYFYSNGNWYHVNDFVSLLYSFIFNLLTLAVIGFPIFTTIVKYIIHKWSHHLTSTLNEDLNYPPIHDLFLQFSKSEWSVENILCWDDIKIFQREANLQVGKDIYEKYFAVGALCEVNFPRRAADKITKMLIHDEYNEHMFDELLLVVTNNMADTYSRFIRTDEYKQAKKEGHMMKDFH